MRTLTLDVEGECPEDWIGYSKPWRRRSSSKPTACPTHPSSLSARSCSRNTGKTIALPRTAETNSSSAERGLPAGLLELGPRGTYNSAKRKPRLEYRVRSWRNPCRRGKPFREHGNGPGDVPFGPPGTFD